MNNIPPELLLKVNVYLPVHSIKSLLCTCSSLSQFSWRLVYTTKYPETAPYTQTKTEAEFYTALVNLEQNGECELSCMARICQCQVTVLPFITANQCFCSLITTHDYSNAFLFSAHTRRCLCYEVNFLQMAIQRSAVQVLSVIVSHPHLVGTHMLSNDLLSPEPTKAAEIAELLLHIPNLKIVINNKSVVCYYLTVKPRPSAIVKLFYPHVKEAFDISYFVNAINCESLSSVYIRDFDINGCIEIFDSMPPYDLEFLRILIEELHLYPSPMQAAYLIVHAPEYASCFMKYDYILNHKMFIASLFSINRGYLLNDYEYDTKYLYLAIINSATASFEHLLTHQDFWYDVTIFNALATLNDEALSVRYVKKLLTYQVHTNQDRLTTFMEQAVKKNHLNLIACVFEGTKISDELFFTFAIRADNEQLATFLATCQLDQPDAPRIFKYYLRRGMINHVKILREYQSVYPAFRSDQIEALLVKYNK